MTRLRLSLQSAAYYAWSHLCVTAGVALSVAVLTGALLVGDSVRYSLRQMALLRLGTVKYALEAPQRYFKADLADRLQKVSHAPVAPALVMQGMAIHVDDTAKDPVQINNVQIIGIDDRFQKLSLKVGGQGHDGTLPETGIVLNAKLADRLGVKVGDMVALRFTKPSFLPLDAPLASKSGDNTIRVTFTVVGIWGDDQLGRFSLLANQVVPCNVFVNLESLQQASGLRGRANLLLTGGADKARHGRGLPTSGSIERLSALQSDLEQVWQLDDIGLFWRADAKYHCLQLESDRVLLEPSIGKAAFAITNAMGTLTYLVNSIARLDEPRRMTPYSFVLAKDDETVGSMDDDAIIVNQWLADKLGVKNGESVRMTYFESTPSGHFLETNRIFTVRNIVGMAGLECERALAPRFPGLTDVGRCADWDIGLPLNEEWVQDADNEVYWNTYRDTPKAVVRLKTGQAMWANRFGNLTSIRFPVAPSLSLSTYEADVTSRLRCLLNPAEFGLIFKPVHDMALKSVNDSMDLGQLFLGMSLFVIVAALMLTGLLFSFGIRQRTREVGLLLAVGFRASQVRLLLLRESVWVAGAGSVLGAGLGVLYTKGLIWGLEHLWQGAVAFTSISFHAEVVTICLGAMMGFATAVIALISAAWRQTNRPAHDLLCDASNESVTDRIPSIMTWLLPAIGLLTAVILISMGASGRSHDTIMMFFVAGALLLMSFLGLTRALLVRLGQNMKAHELTIATVGYRNAGRNRLRSLTVIGLLAAGCFVVFAVSAMRENLDKNAHERNSGTGGFSLIGESSLPLIDDLTSAAGRKTLRLNQEPHLMNVELIPVKVHEGDDAGCLNLNRAQAPRLLGVDPADFESRGAFGSATWQLLRESNQDGCVPGLAGDSNTAQWGLMKRVGPDGDVLVMKDERGQDFKVKLVGCLPTRLSVFQGSVLISARAFAEHYPSESGLRMFLADVPSGYESLAQRALARCLGKFGINVVPSVERLKEYYAVESAYMAMFFVLGGMGLLLGSAGMGMVVLRSMLERRAEFATLKALGYQDKVIKKMVTSEHYLMLGTGLLTGMISALAAVWPNLRDPGVAIPVRGILVLLVGIALFHMVWIHVSIVWSLRTPALAALRDP